MEQTFLNGIKIKKVRHLHDITIPLSEEKRKHLILTGKNGSGKTSVIEALVKHFQFIISDRYESRESLLKSCDFWEKRIQALGKMKHFENNYNEIQQAESDLEMYREGLENWESGAVLECNSFISLRDKYNHGNFILAYYKDERKFRVEQYKNIEKVELEKNIG